MTASHEKLYLDGELIKQRNSLGYDIWESETSCYLGGWRGYLSSFRISNTAKYSGQAYEVPALKLKAETDSVLLYNFNGIAGTKVADESGNGRDGTLGGADFRFPNPSAPAVTAVP
jgi:hypothetical protein